jgi:hypothetical protein
MTTVFPAVEPLRADLTGDGMDLPIYNFNIGGAQSFAVQVQRHGLRLKIAKRFVDESAYPWTWSLRPSGATRDSRARATKADRRIFGGEHELRSLFLGGAGGSASCLAMSYIRVVDFRRRALQKSRSAESRRPEVGEHSS